MKQQAEQFSATMTETEIAIKHVTGGDSFAVVSAPFIPVNGENTFRLIIYVRGRYDLSDVILNVVKLPDTAFGTVESVKHLLAGDDTNTQSVSMGNISHKNPRVVPLSISPASDGSITEYSINVFAKNRMTHEVLRIKKQGKQWQSSFTVIDGDTHKVLERSKPEWRSFAITPPS